MKVPETYEEYLKTPYDELIKISKSKKTFEEAKRLISFVNRAEFEFRDKEKRNHCSPKIPAGIELIEIDL